MLPKQIENRLWKVSFLWGALFFAFWTAYELARAGAFTFGSLVSNLEWTAAVMIAISYAFGTFTFYTNFLDAKLVYRKYFGLVGYFALLLYAVLLMLGRSDWFFSRPYAGFLTVDFQMLCAVLLVLCAMTIVGNSELLSRKQPRLWRNFLRAGYIIYLFWIPRLILLDGADWNAWGAGSSASFLPPASLVVVILAFLVVAFRLSVFPVLLWQHHVHNKELPRIS